MFMRLLACGLLCLAATAVGAQMPMPNQEKEPLQFLAIPEVKKQIEEARGVPGPRVPTAEERRRVVAEVDGTPITAGELLDEVTNRFAGALEMPLLNQALMRMEALKRGAAITDDDFVKGVRAYLAQKKSIQIKQSLREILQESQLSWATFERMIGDQAKVQKLVRADLKLQAKGDEPLNPMVMQIWAGQVLRGKYQVVMDATKLPPGVLGAVNGSRPVGDVLTAVAGGGFVVSVTGNNEMQITPDGEGWPRYKAPNVMVDRVEPDGKRTRIAVADVARWVADPARTAAEKTVVRTIRVTVEGGKPVVLPPTMIYRKNDKSGIVVKAPLAELLDAVSTKDFTRQEDGHFRKTKDSWPAYSITKTPPPGVAELLQQATGKPVTVAGLARIGGRFELPDVPVTMYCHVNRDYILAFSYGKLRPVHYEEALKSLSQLHAVKHKFAELKIKVDEAKVQALVDAENKKYNHPLFNRKMILQAKGTTPFDEDRKIWVANGVDQVIGTDISEETLRKYYQDNILHFGKAKVRAAHILVEAVDPATGKEDWATAEQRINELAQLVFGSPDPRRAFPEIAQRFSQDAQTAQKGGDLGEFQLRGQMAQSFADAAFALNPGEISAPVRSTYGYHLIFCIKRTPPDLQANALEKPEILEQVKQEYQEGRRKAWLEQNVYAGMTVKRLAGKLFGGAK